MAPFNPKCKLRKNEIKCNLQSRKKSPGRQDGKMKLIFFEDMTCVQYTVFVQFILINNSQFSYKISKFDSHVYRV